MAKANKVVAVSVSDTLEARILNAMKTLREGAAALSGVIEDSAKQARGITKTMVREWKPLLTFKDGKVDESTEAFKVMRKEFREAVRKAQKDNPDFSVEYRKVDHGSGIGVWTARDEIEDADKKADVINKLDVFNWTPGMREHDIKKVAPALAKQVYKVEIDRLNNNERQAFNNFKLALNGKVSGGANGKDWQGTTWKRLESHLKARVKDGFTDASVETLRERFDDMMDEVFGY